MTDKECWDALKDMRAKTVKKKDGSGYKDRDIRALNHAICLLGERIIDRERMSTKWMDQEVENGRRAADDFVNKLGGIVNMKLIAEITKKELDDFGDRIKTNIKQLLADDRSLDRQSLVSVGDIFKGTFLEGEIEDGCILIYDRREGYSHE